AGPYQASDQIKGRQPGPPRIQGVEQRAARVAGQLLQPAQRRVARPGLESPQPSHELEHVGRALRRHHTLLGVAATIPTWLILTPARPWHLCHLRSPLTRRTAAYRRAGLCYSVV